MMIRRGIMSAVLGCILMVPFLGGVGPVFSQTDTEDGVPALRIRVRNVERLMQHLEALLPADSGANVASQTALVKGMLQGTDWIDPARSLVADMQFDGQSSAWLILVPFRRPNDNFQSAYGAVGGDDHYLLRFPPAPERPLPDRRREDLLQASAATMEASLVVELAASRLLRQSESQIEAAVQGMASQASAGTAATTPAPEDIQQMARDLVATFKQVETLRLGVDIDPETLLLLVDVRGVPDSFLAGLLVDQNTDVRLGGYVVDYPLQFRSRSYNVAGAIQMLGASFGQFYRQMGFDFEELAEIGKGLTGEMAGGMALDQGVMNFEMIYALHDAVDGESYLTDVYLPWFQKYNRQMASLMEAQTGQPVTPLYERMPDATVAGKRVYGVRTRFPAMSPVGGGVPAEPVLQNYETRLAAVDNLILMASSEAIIARMISSTAGFQKAPAQGPMARFSMDLGAYLKGLQTLMPEAGRGATIPPDIGELTLVANMQAGQLTTRTRMKIKDVQRTMALLADMSTGPAATGPAAAADSGGGEIPPPSADQSPASAPSERPKTAAYWMDRGGLLSAYGSYTAAVRSYRKALALDPDLAEAYFQLGVAYGELGQFDAAVAAIAQAIDRRPANGAYFYGRGRIYLKAGDTDLAMKDFMEAGFLGNADARAYLEETGVDWDN